MGTYPKIPKVAPLIVVSEFEALSKKYAKKDDAFTEFVTRLSTELAFESEKTLLYKTYLWRRGEIVFQPKRHIVNGIYEGKTTPVFEAEPGSVFRVLPDSKNPLFLRSIPDASPYFPIKECEEVSDILQLMYDSQEGI